MEREELTFDEEGHAVCPTCQTDIVTDSFSEQETAEYVLTLSIARKNKPLQRVRRFYCQDKEELEIYFAVFGTALEDARKRLAERLAEMHIRASDDLLQGESEA